MAEPSFATFLERSLAALVAEMPDAYAELCRTLGRRGVALAIDEERIGVACDGVRLVLGLPDRCPGVQFQTDRVTLLELTQGRLSFLNAALDGRILVQGRVEDVIAFYDALMVYLHGSVRSPSLPALLSEFTAPAGEVHDG